MIENNYFQVNCTHLPWGFIKWHSHPL